jgi:hypothetical protein
MESVAQMSSSESSCASEWGDGGESGLEMGIAKSKLVSAGRGGGGGEVWDGRSGILFYLNVKFQRVDSGGKYKKCESKYWVEASSTIGGTPTTTIKCGCQEELHIHLDRIL